MKPNPQTFRTMCERQTVYSQTLGIETTPSAFERGLITAKLQARETTPQPETANGIIVRIAHFVATLFNRSN